jgi:hypothetical protein
MQPNHPQHGPQGYPQGPQQGPQPYPQQGYQMGPPQYYPPQKKGMPGWAIALIVCAVFFFLVIPIMALAAIPLITSNTRDARHAEGEQMMYSSRDMARVYFARSGSAPRTLTETDLSPADLEGMYYRVDDSVGGNNDRGEITCTPIQTPSDGRGHLSFSWMDGDGTVRWD